MKAYLMYRDRDFDLAAALPPQSAELEQDLALDVLFGAMAEGDRFLRGVARVAILTGLERPDDIRYRQQILADCLEQPTMARELYAVAIDAIEREKKIWGVFGGPSPGPVLHRSVQVLALFSELLRRLRLIADRYAGSIHSEGFTRFFRMIADDLDDRYLGVVDDHLRRLAFREGVFISASLGQGNKGVDHVLRQPGRARKSWIRHVLPDRSRLVYEIADRDEAGARALDELRDRGLGLAARAVAQSTDHILSFFTMLRTELAFYVGCLNLREQLARKGEPVCLPNPTPSGHPVLSALGLYDVSLSLSVEERVVGNDVDADHRSLVMITGANRGGKSTFLRSVGLAQLMMQSGMYVAAESFRANVCDRVFTHFKREEDATMQSGKLDEELKRMSAIIDHVTPRSAVLLNESFASTNEREGSEIARQIVRALEESGVRVVYVTHLFDLAHGFHAERAETALFLRAERRADGTRTYRLVEGEPLPTSHADDVYRRIFGAALGGVAAGPLA